MWLLLWWDGWGERGNHRMSRDGWTFRMCVCMQLMRICRGQEQTGQDNVSCFAGIRSQG